MVQMEGGEDETLAAGRHLAHPSPGEEVVISGTSGAFPDSDSVTEFADKLFDKVDLISGDGRRWTLDHPEIPQRTGKINNIEKFDAGFFGIHYKQAHAMDPMCRMVLEKTAEAVLDAGYNPTSLKGKKIGVFVGACFSETEKTWFYEKLQVNGFGVTGCARAMLANRISYWLGIKGPSYTVDTACSSSLYAFEHGYRAIRDGLCDAAIVAGTNLCLHPYVSLQFSRLGVLSKDGRCKCFDEAANGYCRSEGISVVLLQKKKDARRIYATVVHAKTNCDGYKEQGITFPSGPLQQVLLEEFYQECQVDPTHLAWIEAHGTGTKVGDPEEVKAIENVFCKGRSGPLKIGSLKSNTGHSEPVSGLLSITKVLIAMETGYIPPNINFNNPRKDIDALFNGKIEVVTEKTAWPGGMVGVNSFGFGGANCHVLLRSNEKEKVDGGRPKDDLPRLVAISGRTEEAVNTVLSFLENHPLDAEYVKLYHEIFKDEIPGHMHRGHIILSKSGSLGKATRPCHSLRPPVWFFFPGAGLNWKNHAEHLCKLPMFSQIITKCHNILKPYHCDLMSLLTKNTADKDSNDSFKAIMTTCVMQIAIVNFMKSLKYEPDGIIGMSYGEIACAYCDGAITLEQAVLTAYHVATIFTETVTAKGKLAVIEMPVGDLKKICPGEVVIASEGLKSCMVSGPEGLVSGLMEKAVKSQAKVHTLASTPLHSRYSASAKTKLISTLHKVLTEHRQISEKWVTTSSKNNVGSSSKVSGEMFCSNLLGSVYLDEKFNAVPYDASVVEISPDSLLDIFLNKAMKKKRNFHQILDNSKEASLVNFLDSLGRMYLLGVNMDLAQLYPAVALPVSRSTPMISPLVRWDHSDDWYVATYKTQDQVVTGERFISISVKDDDMEYVTGHVVDGRNLFPATGYLVLVWESLALMNSKFYGELPVVFENIRFNRATNLPKDGHVEFAVTIQRSSGNFEIMESGAAIVTGRVYIPEDVAEEASGIEINVDMEEYNKSGVLYSKDLYKELRLRGYNYTGLFKGMVTKSITEPAGFVKWQNNWVAFMDNLLQLKIIEMDTRGLFVPTRFQRVFIDPKKHMEIVNALPEDKKEVPVLSYNFVNLIVSGGVEIRGLSATSIARRKPLGEPVLESYQFHPYQLQQETLSMEQAVRALIHICLENLVSLSIKVAEVGDYKGSSETPHLTPAVIRTLGDLPLLQPDVSLYANMPEKPEGFPPEINVEDKKLPSDQSALFVIGNKLLAPDNNASLESAMNATKENGFIIAREDEDLDIDRNDLIKLASIHTEGEYLILLKKIAGKSDKKYGVMTVKNDDFSWLKPLQEMLKAEEFERIILVSEHDPLSGIVGFHNCLYKEGNSEKLRTFFIIDEDAPPFSLDNPFYNEQFKKDLAVNVYKNGQWGSFRHFDLKADMMVSCPHAYISFHVRGDLSSATWTQGNLESKPPSELIHVYYSALNFRDVMTATGKLPSEIAVKSRLAQDCVQGLEYSGRDAQGKRVMGLVGCKSLSNMLCASDSLFWHIPDDWTLEEAATIPCVYATILYAFEVAGKLRRGETILIHAGTGGIGQAAIHYALFHGCKVFTTVGTPEKRQFLKDTFPELTDSQIGNSRDTSFEQLVMRETGGRGVDVVMNSLAEEKLLASVRCLARGGRFLELGKFDMANDNPLGMEFLLRDASFHGIMLNVSFQPNDVWKHRLWALIEDGLKEGSIKPFSRTVFQRDQVEQAFRFMAAGKHLGKVLIKIRDEEPEKIFKPDFLYLDAEPRFHCVSSKTYIIIGGLGGFGLELADWLVLRGGCKLVLCSRSGVKDGYQAYRIKTWRSYGVEVEIYTEDLTTSEGALRLLKTANTIGPVGGIFNLALVLKDGTFDNQTEENFQTLFQAKADATRYLDQHSRVECPSLDKFVVFSSVSCGRGNPGQTNYGMSNSVMERVCEQRVKDGLPAVAMEWGAVGDVGVVAELMQDNMELVIGGTLPQKIDSCLAVLDKFLHEKYPILSSMVVAEKKAGSGGAGNIVDTVVNIIGLRDLKSVSMHSTLAELGMDSMMAVEIKQTLEREFEVFLTPQDIRGMTFAKLQDIAKNKSSGTAPPTEAAKDTNAAEDVVKDARAWMNLFRNVAEEKIAKLPIVRINNEGSIDHVSPGYKNKLFLLAGIEGFVKCFENLSPTINCEAVCLQYDYESPRGDTIEGVAESTLKRMQDYISKDEVVRLVGYSFGGVVALAMTHMLEKDGYRVNLCLIDSSVTLLKEVLKFSYGNVDDLELESRIILSFLDATFPQERVKAEQVLRDQPNWETRVKVAIEASGKNVSFSNDYKTAMMTAFYQRAIAIRNYKGVPEKSIRAPVTLIKPTDNILKIAEDYGISEYTQNAPEIHVVEGNHVTVVDNVKTSEIINQTLLRK